MFLDTCCKKILNFVLKQIFSCILKINFLIQDVQQILDNFLTIIVLTILLLQNIITTKK